MNLGTHPARVVAAVGAVIAAGTTTVMALTVGTASADEPGRCTQNVNVREEPNATSRIVALCEEGTEVMLGAERDHFVFLDKLHGWASKDFVKPDETASGQAATDEHATDEHATDGHASDGHGTDAAAEQHPSGGDADHEDADSAGHQDADSADHGDADHGDAAPATHSDGADGDNADAGDTARPASTTGHRSGGLGGLLR